MLDRSLKALATAALASGLLAGVSATADAQSLNMDMSWGIQSQMQNWNYAQQAAQAAAQNYLNYMQELRRRGYTGRSLPTGVTPDSLRNSINAMNNAFSDYNKAQLQNSQRLSNSVHDYTMRAIRGCWLSADPYGRPVYVCP